MSLKEFKAERMKNLAIIPARSGSKGLPDKNIKKLCGKPLIVYSIEAAIESGCFDTVMVSTDSEKYALLAEKHGAEVPFMRSDRTSSDSATSDEMILEVLDNYGKLGKNFDTFCLLQPTSPLRTSEDIKLAYREFEKKNAFSLISMTEVEHPMAWCGIVDKDNGLNGFIKKSNNTRRQAQEVYYRPNGAIYIVRIPEYRNNQFLYREGSYAYKMPLERSIDIDTEFDFMFAEFVFNYNKESDNRC